MKPIEPWNKGKVVGRKPPLSPEQVKLVKMLLKQAGNLRDLALFSLAIDSSLRGSDLVKMKVKDLYDGEDIREVANIRQKKTSNPKLLSHCPVQQVLRKQNEKQEVSGTDLLTGAHVILWAKGKSRSLAA